MSTETHTKVQAELRENFGKGFARRLRAAGKIPAVIYGHGTDPVHVALPGHQMSLLVRRANVVLELDVAGKQQLTLVKDVQKDPVHQIIEHIDLLVVKKGEKVERYKASGAIGSGDGEKAGVAYRMKDGSIVYVPEGGD